MSKKVTGPKKKIVPKILSKDKNAPPPSEKGLKNIDFSKIVQNCPKTVYRGVFCRNFRFCGLKNSKSSFWWSKSPSNDKVLFFEKFDFVTFFGCFRPVAAKKSDFSKKDQTTPK